MPTLESDGARLHYEIKGSGPAILFSHGFASSSEFWAGQVSPLRGKWRSICWDMRGHGRSDYPADQSLYDEAHTVEDMLRLLDAAKEEKAVLCGFSLGGYMSLAFWYAHPERVSALVLYGTGPGFRNAASRQKWNAFGESWAARLENGGLAETREDPDKAIATTHRSADGLVRVARGMFPQRDSRIIDKLPEINVPVLIIVGREDPLLAGSQYMSRKIPGAELVQIPDATHPANIEQEAAFNDALVAFLGRIRPSL
jgi:pimeloyl-ACP methyl ester carboxylesterase